MGRRADGGGTALYLKRIHWPFLFWFIMRGRARFASGGGGGKKGPPKTPPQGKGKTRGGSEPKKLDAPSRWNRPKNWPNFFLVFFSTITEIFPKIVKILLSLQKFLFIRTVDQFLRCCSFRKKLPRASIKFSRENWIRKRYLAPCGPHAQRAIAIAIEKSVRVQNNFLVFF